LKTLSFDEIKRREKRLQGQIEQYKFMFPKWSVRPIEELVLEIREPQHITLGYKKYNNTIYIAHYLFNEDGEDINTTSNIWEKCIVFFISKYSFKDNKSGYVVRWSNIEFEKYKKYSYQHEISGESFKMTGEVNVDDLSSEELKPVRTY